MDRLSNAQCDGGAPVLAVQIFVIGFTDKLWNAVPIINVAFTCHYNGPRFYQVRVRAPRSAAGRKWAGVSTPEYPEPLPHVPLQRAALLPGASECSAHAGVLCNMSARDGVL